MWYDRFMYQGLCEELNGFCAEYGDKMLQDLLQDPLQTWAKDNNEDERTSKDFRMLESVVLLQTIVLFESHLNICDTEVHFWDYATEKMGKAIKNLLVRHWRLSDSDATLFVDSVRGTKTRFTGWSLKPDRENGLTLFTFLSFNE